MFAEGVSLRAAVVTVVLVLVAAMSSCGTSEADGKVVVADPAEAVRLISSGEYVVVDLRPAPAFEAGHVHGARSLPYSSPDEFAGKVAALDASGRYLIYAQSKDNSDLAAEQLAALGFEHVVDAGAFGLLALAGATVE